MTKDAYFEMCNSLGTDPIKEEIPLELDDLFIEVQEALSIYSVLRDDWDYMNGNYIGKHLDGIIDIFTIYQVPIEEQKLLLNIINIIDRVKIKIYQDNKPKP